MFTQYVSYYHPQAPEPQVHHPNDRTEEGAVSDSEYVELLQLREEVVNLRLILEEKDANLKTQQEEYRKTVSAYLALQREMKDGSGKVRSYSRDIIWMCVH